MRIVSIFILGLVAVLGVSFAVLNAHPVRVSYYLGSRDIPLSMLLFMTFVLGILLGMLSLYPRILRLKFELRRLRRNHG